MADAPLYGGPKVGAEAQPGARITTQVSPESQGAALGRGLNDVASAAEDVYQREREKQNSLVLMDADLKAGLLANKLNNDAMQVKGKDTLGLHEDMLPKLQEGMDGIEQSLATPEQRDAFRRIAAGHIKQFDDTLLRHTTQQMQQWGDQTAEASKQLASDQIPQLASQGDMAGVQAQFDKIKQVTAAQGLANGWDQKRVDAETSRMQSAGHLSVIDTMLANDQDITAKKYYDANKGDLVGRDVVVAAAKVEASSTRAEASRQADSLISAAMKDDGSIKELDVEAGLKKIQDPKIREAATAVVMGRIDLHNKALAQMHGQVADQARNLIDATPGTVEDKIQAVETSLSDKQFTDAYYSTPAIREQVQKYAQYSAAGVEPATDWKVYAEWESLSPAERAKMSLGEVMTKYRPSLDNSSYQHVLTMWNAANSSVVKKQDMAPDQTNLIDFKDRMKNAFVQIHPELGGKALDSWGQDNVQEYIALEKAAQFRINALEAGGAGKSKDGKATPEQIQQEVDKIQMQNVFVPGRLYGGANKFTGMLSEADRARAVVPYASIPVPVIAQIKGLAQSLGNSAGLTETDYERAAALIRMRAPDDEIKATLSPKKRFDAIDLMKSGQ